MKLHWLLISSLIANGLVISSAQASRKLSFWEVEEYKSQLTFSTEEEIQPKAQLISEPTQLFIDLSHITHGHDQSENLINQSNDTFLGSSLPKKVEYNTTSLAQSITPNCPEQEQYDRVAPASTSRLAKLETLGIQVEIPSNYRTMLSQDGTVYILHPATYGYIQCLNRGDARGRGFFAETLSTIESKSTMSFREQVIEYLEKKGYDTPQLIPYENSEISGYIENEYMGTFIGHLPNREKLLIADLFCDCVPEIYELIDLLSRISLLDENN